MHIPQVWSFWDNWKSRWSVRSSSQHHQRKDLHFCVVLVRALDFVLGWLIYQILAFSLTYLIVFCYFRFVFLACLTAFHMLYRLATMLLSSLRVSNLHVYNGGIVQKHKIHAALNIKHHNYFERLGDYLFLYNITMNLSPLLTKVGLLKHEQNPLDQSAISLWSAPNDLWLS